MTTEIEKKAKLLARCTQFIHQATKGDLEFLEKCFISYEGDRDDIRSGEVKLEGFLLIEKEKPRKSRARERNTETRAVAA